MKILHVTNAYPTKRYPAYGSFIQSQIDSLSKRNILAEVFFINAKENGKIEYLKSIRKLRKVLRNGRFDIIHCHHVYAAAITLLAKKNEKIVTSFLSDGYREIMLPGNRLYGSRILSWIITRSDGKIFKKAIPSYLEHDDFSFYLPNGVNTEHFVPVEQNIAKKHLNLDPTKRYILFVSANSLHRREKRYDIFRNVMKQLAEKYDLRDVEELLMVKAQINELPYYYSAAEIHLLVSDFEGSPNSVKECLSCGTKVISRDVGNVYKMIYGIVGCKVIRGSEPGAYSKAINDMLSISIDPPILRQEIFDRKLDMESKTSELVDIYCRVLDK